MQWQDIRKVISAADDAAARDGGASPNVLLFGRPATGKTTYANQVLGANGRRVHNITVTEESSKSELEGFWMLDGDGICHWFEGVGTSAWLNGEGLVINEIDKASGAVAVALHAYLDDPGIARLTLPDRRTIRPAPGFRAFATMNGVPDDLEPALRDRFRLNIEVVAPPEEAMAGMRKEDREFLIRAYSDPQLFITLREFWQFLALCGNDVHEDLAAEAIWNGRGRDVLTARRLGKRAR